MKNGIVIIGRGHGKTKLMEELTMEKNTYEVENVAVDGVDQGAAQVTVEPVRKNKVNNFEPPRPLLNRKERRELSKKVGVPFKPMYNNQDGVRDYEDYHGVPFVEKIPKKKKRKGRVEE